MLVADPNPVLVVDRHPDRPGLGVVEDLGRGPRVHHHVTLGRPVILRRLELVVRVSAGARTIARGKARGRGGREKLVLLVGYVTVYRGLYGEGMGIRKEFGTENSIQDV